MFLRTQNLTELEILNQNEKIKKLLKEVSFLTIKELAKNETLFKEVNWYSVSSKIKNILDYVIENSVNNAMKVECGSKRCLMLVKHESFLNTIDLDLVSDDPEKELPATNMILVKNFEKNVAELINYYKNIIFKYLDNLVTEIEMMKANMKSDTNEAMVINNIYLPDEYIKELNSEDQFYRRLVNDSYKNIILDEFKPLNFIEDIETFLSEPDPDNEISAAYALIYENYIKSLKERGIYEPILDNVISILEQNDYFKVYLSISELKFIHINELLLLFGILNNIVKKRLFRNDLERRGYLILINKIVNVIRALIEYMEKFDNKPKILPVYLTKSNNTIVINVFDKYLNRFYSNETSDLTLNVLKGYVLEKFSKSINELNRNSKLMISEYIDLEDLDIKKSTYLEAYESLNKFNVIENLEKNKNKLINIYLLTFDEFLRNLKNNDNIDVDIDAVMKSIKYDLYYKSILDLEKTEAIVTELLKIVFDSYYFFTFINSFEKAKEIFKNTDNLDLYAIYATINVIVKILLENIYFVNNN